MPSRNRQRARKTPHVCARRRLTSAGGFVGTETKRGCDGVGLKEEVEKLGVGEKEEYVC
jgi:hypothetical protein